MVELSNLAGWDFDLTIKFNASTSEEQEEDCEWFVCGAKVAFDIKQVASQFSLFFPWDQQAAGGSLLRIEVILTNTSLLLNTLRKKGKM